MEWDALRPADAARLLRGLDARWWVAGGWALDLHLGAIRRAHKDLDVMLLRRDLAKLRAALPGWEHALAHDGALTAWEGGDVPAHVNSLWSRPAGSERWQLEFVLDHADGETWRYRRDARVTRPLASLGRPGGALVPEVVLLYKAKLPAQDDDFAALVPRLGAAARAWLAEAIALAHPDSSYRAAF
jgi:hypothetical protein